MGPQEWEIVVAAVASGVLTLGSWMFMVHAKLAVIAARIIDLSERVEKAAESNRELWRLCAAHTTRLETHDVQFAHIAQRLEDLS